MNKLNIVYPGQTHEFEVSDEMYEDYLESGLSVYEFFDGWADLIDPKFAMSVTSNG